MLTVLAFSALAVAGVAIGGALFIPLIVIGGLIWLITLPIRLLFGFVFGGLFRLVFGLFGAVLGTVSSLLGFLLAPLGILVAGVGIAAVLGTGAIALVPVVPIAIVGLMVWGIYRLVRPTPRPMG